MKYSEIQEAVERVNRLLRERDYRIRTTAEQLLDALRGAEFGFPSHEVCLQPIDHPLDDCISFHPIQLPSDDESGGRGFRIRFQKNHGGYLSRVFCVVSWSFTIDDEKMTAQIKGESRFHQSALKSPVTNEFITSLANDTVAFIAKMISRIPNDDSNGKEMGFHSLQE